jgi:hypothetical protein
MLQQVDPFPVRQITLANPAVNVRTVFTEDPDVDKRR